MYHRAPLPENSCSTFLAISAVLGGLLFLSAAVMCWLASRLHVALLGNSPKSIDQIVREHTRHESIGYTGRATTQ